MRFSEYNKISLKRDILNISEMEVKSLEPALPEN